MTVVALAIVRLRNLFAVVMLMAVFSLLSAVLYVLLTAVDVAFTEAAVGAGISTLLVLGAISLTSERGDYKPEKFRPFPLLIVIATGAVLIYGTLDMPRYGDPNAPANKHVAPRYIEQSGKEVGVPNIVTSVLASYRGYDTLGEVVVIFTAAIGVLILLGRGHNRWRPGLRPGQTGAQKEEEV
jgi:multicomponent Na+:H+ antiporter subunit B|tara:strand:+ start:664 stop:1212 length:549 start_codon:yes stop_codon:yes gene_type:complete